jgi:O-methyltransferase
LSLSLSPIAREVVRRHLSTLTPQKILNLEQAMKTLDRDSIPGDVLECGLNHGGSAVLLALMAKPERRFIGYGMRNNLDDTLATFRSLGVDADGRSVALRVYSPDGAPEIEPKRALALAHINCDWESCAPLCLETTAAHLSSGGFLMLDDHNQSERCTAVVGNFLVRHGEFSLVGAKSHTVVTRNV